MIVEDDAETADRLVHFVQSNGGEAVGPFACTREALAVVREHPDVDSVMVGADLQGDLALPLVRQLERRHVSIIWIIGHDGRFVAADGEGDALVYRLAGDPHNVMRVSLAH
ncbi:hypothetical protein [Aureimonas leprariae]|uniref:Response regulatory domain-containing protein n=1 Tax=Plantimonas leprariae TaxID=2615207 RepID=A0A7V7PMS9_9HYPH|nr:hypothetical protein [Aureimonas leprariae]KAB0678499.1 hypothetical protein F6X38_15845 [Aureimonas leprariae]